MKCYEYSQDGVSLNSFGCCFFHKKIGCTNKTEIKDGYQYANRKLSLRGYTVICTPEDLVMN